MKKMSNAYLPHTTGITIIRQWLVFPTRYSRSHRAHLHSFKLLVERSIAAEVSFLSYLNSNQKLLSSYLEWARDYRSKDKLALTLLMRPAVAALDQILPEEYTFLQLKALCMDWPECVLDMKSINWETK